jgi:SSS family solute:Na+ symporter
VSVGLLLVVSYLTKPLPESQLQGLTYATTVAEDKQKSRQSWSWKEVTASVVVVLIILSIYVYFRG